MNTSPEISCHQFTPQRETEAEEYLSKCVMEAREIICSNTNPLSIYLQGSFGRGEGTIYYDGDDGPKIWKDLDMILIYKTRESPEKLSDIKSEINASLGLEKNTSTVEGGYISLAQLPELVVKRWRDLKMFELANNSLHVSGKDIRSDMNANSGGIPLVSGERYLLQKCKGLCKVHEYINDRPVVANYEAAKTYHEIGNSLALKLSNPIADTQERIEFLKNSDFPGLNEIPEKVQKYSRYKLEGDFEGLSEMDSSIVWKEAKEDLLRTLSYYTNMGNKSGSMTKNIDTYYERLKRIFLKDMFSSILSKKWPPSPITRFLSRFPDMGYKAYSSLRISSGFNSIVCSLSAAYVSWLLLLDNLRTGIDRVAEKLSYYLSLAGVDSDSNSVQGYINDTEMAYNRAARPLYGLS